MPESNENVIIKKRAINPLYKMKVISNLFTEKLCV